MQGLSTTPMSSPFFKTALSNKQFDSNFCIQSHIIIIIYFTKTFISLFRCGLVALAIISQTYSQPVSVSQLLAEARVRGFTQYGEVYSVDFMSTLAAEYLPEHRPEIIVDDQNSIDTISQALINGTVILAPYDADFNHAPCLKRGHKAHWALLVGIISSR